VVIPIVAILAALLLPALGKAKQRAQVTASVNNMRQLGLARMLYADDFQVMDPTSHSAIWAGSSPTVAPRRFT